MARREKRAAIVEFIFRFRNPLVLILLIVGIISGLFGEVLNSTIIFARAETKTRACSNLGIFEAGEAFVDSSIVLYCHQRNDPPILMVCRFFLANFEKLGVCHDGPRRKEGGEDLV